MVRAFCHASSCMHSMNILGPVHLRCLNKKWKFFKKWHLLARKKSSLVDTEDHAVITWIGIGSRLRLSGDKRQSQRALRWREWQKDRCSEEERFVCILSVFLFFHGVQLSVTNYFFELLAGEWQTLLRRERSKTICISTSCGRSRHTSKPFMDRTLLNIPIEVYWSDGRLW